MQLNNTTMELLEIEIYTSRLFLQPISMKYKEDIFREFTEEITIYMHPRPPKEIFETESFINDSVLEMKNGNHLIFVILEKDTQEFLGCTGIHEINTQKPLFGIWLKKSAHGKGYGLETISALKTWAEDNLDYEYLVYPVDKANIPSRRIPEKLGGEIFKEYDWTNLSGKILNLVEYKILKR